MTHASIDREPVLSIIVPMYNVAPFLPRCLDSIDAQTALNFEVILIDDCSTDDTLEIAREYAGRRNSWTVVKNEANLGIAATRNLGVNLARGEFIGFVDADDWAEPTMFETLLNAAISTGSDISQIQYEIRSAQTTHSKPQSNTVRVISGIEALEAMLLTEKYAVWFMLYHRSLFQEGVEWFPVGLTCEDRVANSWLLPRANHVAVSSRVEYYYFLNLGSISHSGLDRRSLDLLEADRLVISNIEKLDDPLLLKLARGRAAKGSYSLLVKWARFGITDPSLDEGDILPMLWADFKNNYGELMDSPLPASKKIVAWQLAHCPSLLRLEFSVHRKLAYRKGAQS